MRLSPTYLHELIGQLGKAEKRAVRLFAQNRHSKYLKLFDLLKKHPAEDSKAFNSALHKEGLEKKQLPALKQYLYQVILEALDHHGERDLHHKGTSFLSKAQLLLSLGLKNQALVLLSKGKQFARKYELFTLELSLLETEKQAIHPSFESESNLHQQIGTCMDQLKNVNDYWWLLREISNWQLIQQPLDQASKEKAVDQYLAHHLLESESTAISVSSKIFYHQALASLYFVKRKPRQAYKANAHILELIEQQPGFTERFSERYLVTLSNYLVDSLLLNEDKALMEGLEKLKSIPEQSAFAKISNIEVRVFRQRFLLETNWHLRNKQYTAAVKLLPELVAGIEAYESRLQKPHLITLQYLTAYLFFWNNEYESASDWLTPLLDDYKQEVVKVVYYAAQLLNLLIHLKLQNTEYLFYNLKNTKRKIKAKRDLTKLETAFFEFLQKNISVVEKAEKKRILHNFMDRLQAIKKDPKERQLLEYVDFEGWFKTQTKSPN